MKAAELSIPGAWEFVPQQFPDDRGSFLVWYDAAVFADALGFELSLAQTNHSVSRRGVIRGIHWADVPAELTVPPGAARGPANRGGPQAGQAKYIYCPRGALLDVIVDLRVGSPTFGQHEVVRLDTVDYRAVYLAEGLGHGFVALDDDTVVSYLCSARYAPGRERVVHVHDEELAVPWPGDVSPILSERDAQAPGLAELREAGLLPSYVDCQRLYEAQRAGRQA